MVSLGVKKLGVYTDSNLVNLSPVKQVLESLTRHNVPHVVYDNIRVEPTDHSFQAAAEFAKREQLDSFLAVGGGSVIDTTKHGHQLCHWPSTHHNVPVLSLP